MVACQCNHLPEAQLFLKYGADINSRMVDGASSVFLVAQNGYPNVLSFLLKNGANAHAPRKVCSKKCSITSVTCT